MIKANSVRQFIKSVAGLLAITGIVYIQGCSSSGSFTPADADPKGYYDSGTAAVKLSSDNTTDLNITDLQGMVSGNRFMLLSVNEVILYDGTITDITENTFTGTVNIYEDGVLLAGTTTVEGTITSGSSMTGTLTGVGPGNGMFSLTYSLNNSASDLTRVAKEWLGPVNGAPSESLNTIISLVGALSREVDLPFSGTTPVLAGCVIDSSVSTVQPATGVNVYDVSVTLNSCTDTNVNGAYTGFATTQTSADQMLVIAYSNGSFSGSGEIPYNP